MAITKQKKSDILAKLKDQVGKAATMVFVNFHGLPVATVTDMRKASTGNKVGYMVAKKTLIRKAFGEMSIDGSMPELPGEVAIAYSDDQLAPAKGVYDYHKKNPELLKIIGGVFEGAYVDASAMTAIATIPGREVLLGQFVNVINSPIQGLVMALDAIAKKKEGSVA